jgi:GDP-L-fucose synthase
MGELGTHGYPPVTPASSILVTGHRGMVGKTFTGLLAKRGFSRVTGVSRAECDLKDAAKVHDLFQSLRPSHVFHFAAMVGGIKANRSYPADFLYDNLAMQNNVIRLCQETKVEKLVFLGSSCIYPRAAPQPMKEESLMTGPLEPTNEAYALAKIAGLRLAQYCFQQYGLKCLNPIPCNLYGPGDSFDLERSHVLSALVRRFVDARDAGETSLTLWGTGSAKREFMHVEDLAEALLFLVERYDSPEAINVGTGTDVSIRELAQIIAEAVGYTGRIGWDPGMPDGMPRKCLDVTRLRALGYRHRIELRQGIGRVVEEYETLKAGGSVR